MNISNERNQIEDAIRSKYPNTHLGFKKCRDGRIVVLEILGHSNEDRKDIVDKNFAKMRCAKARVLEIYDMHDRSKKFNEAFGIYDISFRYGIGKIVIPSTDFKEDLNEIYASGIHYYLGEEPAYFHSACKSGKIEGAHKKWYDNGQLALQCNYNYGNQDGMYKEWYDNGQLYMDCILKNGKREGLCKIWYESGQLCNQCIYKDGLPDGLYEKWLDNGEMWKRCIYKNGIEVDNN